MLVYVCMYAYVLKGVRKHKFIKVDAAEDKIDDLLSP